MYIGPWQEYNLSRGKASVNTMKTIQQDKLKRDLEQALTSTLDPTAAQAALKAMETILQQQQQPVANSSLPPIHQYTVISNDHGKVISTTTSVGSVPVVPQRPSQGQPRGRRGGNKRPLHLPPLVSSQQQSSYPQISSARELSNGRNPSAASPLSVRSTQSEPVNLPSLLVNPAAINSYSSNHVSKDSAMNSRLIFPLTQQNLERKLQHDHINTVEDQNRKVAGNTNSSNSRQPMYDAAALINFLKMERNNQRAKTEICKLTGWRQSGDKSDSKSALSNGSSGFGIESSNGQKKSSFSEDKEKKMELVKQMKDMYLQKMKERESSKEAPLQVQPPQIKQTRPPTSLSPISSPRVADMDITEEDLLRVSKYFKALEMSSAASQPSKVSSSKSAVISNGSLGISSPRQKITHLELTDDMESDDGLERRSMKMSKSGVSLGGTGMFHSTVGIAGGEEDKLDFLPSSPFKPPTSAPKDVLPYMDEYNGGLDSLLNWTKGLNIDDF